MRPMHRYVRFFILGIVIGSVGVVAPMMASGVGAQTNQPPEGKIVATLMPPVTEYEAQITDPDTDPNSLTYNWNHHIECGNAAPYVDVIWYRWEHGEEHGCAHDTVSHEGVISVAVSDGVSEIKCYYTGSLSGEGNPCLNLARLESTTRLSLLTRKRFGGRLSSVRRCRRSRIMRLFREGQRRVVREATTNAEGEVIFELEEAPKHGRWFMRVTPREEFADTDEDGTDDVVFMCEGDKSNVVEVE